MPVRRGGEAEQCTGRCFIGGGQPGEGGSEALLRGESKQAAGCGGGSFPGGAETGAWEESLH